MLQNEENNGTEEMGLVTPTPVMFGPNVSKRSRLKAFMISYSEQTKFDIMWFTIFTAKYNTKKITEK